eukprot:5160115-Ditylum_brightwellii.AAC.1
MQLVNAQQWLDDKDTRKIHYCRMYLKVMFVSNIVAADGRQILPEYMTNIQERQYYQSNLMWPYQEDPGKEAWALWRK